MSERFEYMIKLNGRPDAVLLMLQSQAYLNSRVSDSDSGSASIEIMDQRFTTTLRLTDSLKKAPSIIRKAIGSEIDWTETQNWPKTLDGDGTAAGEIAINVEGKPAKLTALASLTSTSTGAQIAISGELKVEMRVVGNQIEKLIKSFVEDAFNDIEKGMNDWLDK